MSNSKYQSADEAYCKQVGYDPDWLYDSLCEAIRHCRKREHTIYELEALSSPSSLNEDEQVIWYEIKRKQLIYKIKYIYNDELMALLKQTNLAK